LKCSRNLVMWMVSQGKLKPSFRLGTKRGPFYFDLELVRKVRCNPGTVAYKNIGVPDVYVHSKGSLLWRVGFGEKPLGAIYCSDSWQTCIGKAFQGSATIDPFRDDPYMVGFELARDISLFDLRQESMLKTWAHYTRNGTRMQAQHWAWVVRDKFEDLDGICYYPKRYPNSVTLFIWAEEFQGTLRFRRNLSDSGMIPYLDRVASELGYYLIISSPEPLVRPLPEEFEGATEDGSAIEEIEDEDVGDFMSQLDKICDDTRPCEAGWTDTIEFDG